jgi:hypothetical protein
VLDPKCPWPPGRGSGRIATPRDRSGPLASRSEERVRGEEPPCWTRSASGPPAAGAAESPRPASARGEADARSAAGEGHRSPADDRAPGSHPRSTPAVPCPRSSPSPSPPTTARSQRPLRSGTASMRLPTRGRPYLVRQHAWATRGIPEPWLRWNRPSRRGRLHGRR